MGLIFWMGIFRDTELCSVNSHVTAKNTLELQVSSLFFLAVSRIDAANPLPPRNNNHWGKEKRKYFHVFYLLAILQSSFCTYVSNQKELDILFSNLFRNGVERWFFSWFFELGLFAKHISWKSGGSTGTWWNWWENKEKYFMVSGFIFSILYIIQ